MHARIILHRRPFGKHELIVVAVVAAVAAAGIGALIAMGLRGQPLRVYCAAAMRLPMDQIAADYSQAHGIRVEVVYGGSNVLLSQIVVGRKGDLFLPADESYLATLRERGLVRETIPLATMRPALVVQRGNPKAIGGLKDLLRPDVRTSFANPDQAAIGKVVRGMLIEAGAWADYEKRITATGVFKPTVGDVANDVKLGAVDAGIVWDVIAAMYPELQAVPAPELAKGSSSVTVGALSCAADRDAALRLAEYIASPDGGLRAFRAHGFTVVNPPATQPAGGSR